MSRSESGVTLYTTLLLSIMPANKLRDLHPGLFTVRNLLHQRWSRVTLSTKPFMALLAGRKVSVRLSNPHSFFQVWSLLLDFSWCVTTRPAVGEPAQVSKTPWMKSAIWNDAFSQHAGKLPTNKYLPTSAGLGTVRIPTHMSSQSKAGRLPQDIPKRNSWGQAETASGWRSGVCNRLCRKWSFNHCTTAWLWNQWKGSDEFGLTKVISKPQSTLSTLSTLCPSQWTSALRLGHFSKHLDCFSGKSFDHGMATWKDLKSTLSELLTFYFWLSASHCARSAPTNRQKATYV